MSCFCKLESFPWILSHFCSYSGPSDHDTELYSSRGCITEISYDEFIQHLVDDLGKYVTIATGQDS